MGNTDWLVKKEIYELKSFVMYNSYDQNGESGHYFAIVKCGESWYRLSDMRKKELDISDDRFVTEYASTLFYVLKD
ncbi:hypothetical protein MHBO_003373 [Bonamia ostreae]|uniref:USP domain-containing protein n=1 Tax=Bonamia ostreae TaxID=126728 RepID=A0ABV2AQT7_9EUKA